MLFNWTIHFGCIWTNLFCVLIEILPMNSLNLVIFFMKIWLILWFRNENVANRLVQIKYIIGFFGKITKILQFRSIWTRIKIKSQFFYDFLRKSYPNIDATQLLMNKTATHDIQTSWKEIAIRMRLINYTLQQHNEKRRTGSSRKKRKSRQETRRTLLFYWSWTFIL